MNPPTAPRPHQPHWSEYANCDGEDTDTFFPALEGKGSTEQARLIGKAKAICGACPVQGSCLNQHLGERHGIFGGTTPEERRVIRNRRSAAARATAKREARRLVAVAG